MNDKSFANSHEIVYIYTIFDISRYELMESMDSNDNCEVQNTAADVIYNGAYLANLMQRHKMKRAELAKYLHCNPSTISHLLQDRGKPLSSKLPSVSTT